MLNIKTLDIKKVFTKPDNTKVLDLTQTSIVYKQNVEIERVVYVTSEFVMRPDLIADAVYGDDNKLDYILKYNDISNPFSIYEGQLLFIPKRDQMQSQFKSDVDDNTDNDATKITLPQDNRYPADKNRQEYLEKIKDGRLNRNEPVAKSPNLVDDGQSNVVFKDNKIIFGSNVTDKPINECPELSTKARIKEALLSKRTGSPINIISTDKKITNITNVNQNNQAT